MGASDCGHDVALLEVTDQPYLCIQFMQQSTVVLDFPTVEGLCKTAQKLLKLLQD